MPMYKVNKTVVRSEEIILEADDEHHAAILAKIRDGEIVEPDFMINVVVQEVSNG